MMRLLLALLCLPVMVQAADYTVNHAESEVAFSGIHAGQEFNGVFENWAADITFDASDLAASQVSVTFDLGSAKTGNKMYDGTLPKSDWFDVKQTPAAKFVSSNFTSAGEGSYSALGLLTLRGVTQPVSFDFSLTEGADGQTIAAGTLMIDRLNYGIGAKSDPNAEWVSQEIGVQFNLLATPTE